MDIEKQELRNSLNDMQQEKEKETRALKAFKIELIQKENEFEENTNRIR